MRRHLSKTDDVARQLSADYPESALSWVKQLTWHGPQEIPLDQVDFTHRRRWNAWKEPDRVSEMAAKIASRAQQGRRIKPVVLVDTPDTERSTNYKVIDGHHRSLAYRQLGKPVWGYVAKTDSNTGPWDEFHAQQFDADSRETTDEFAAKAAWEHELRDLRGEWTRSLTQSDFSGGHSSTEQVTDAAARDIAARWQVSDSDLRALARENGTELPDDPDQAREDMASSLLYGWHGSSGSAPSVAAATHVAERKGLPYQLTDNEKLGQDFIRSSPALDRATRSLGDAIYAGTQKWLADRGITTVHVMRASRRGQEWDDQRPYTSWSLDWGGMRHSPNSVNREQDVPASRVFSIPPTGFGTLAESEVVLLPPGETVTKSASWLAWESDRQQAQQLADSLQQALLAAVDTDAIARDWVQALSTQSLGPGAAESYLLTQLPRVRGALEAVLGPAWQQAWELGEQSARNQLKT